MKAPSLFENIDHWFAIQREKARQNGYYYVEDLGHWSERDREIYHNRNYTLSIFFYRQNMCGMRPRS